MRMKLHGQARHQRVWTDERITELKRLLQEGKKYHQIATALGFLTTYPNQMIHNAVAKYCKG